MMNVYYEINKNVAERYFNGVTNWVEKVDPAGRHNRRALAFSERAWLESKKGVEYIKNRNPPTKVDMEEFMWVKLKSHQLPINWVI